MLAQLDLQLLEAVVFFTKALVEVAERAFLHVAGIIIIINNELEAEEGR